MLISIYKNNVTLLKRINYVSVYEEIVKHTKASIGEQSKRRAKIFLCNQRSE